MVEGGELNPILEPCYPLRGYPIVIWIRGRASTVNSFLAAPPTRGRACFNNELQVTYKSTLTGLVMGCGIEPLSVPGRADAIADRQTLGDSRYTRDAEPRLQFFPRNQSLIFPTILPRQPVEGHDFSFTNLHFTFTSNSRVRPLSPDL